MKHRLIYNSSSASSSSPSPPVVAARSSAVLLARGGNENTPGIVDAVNFVIETGIMIMAIKNVVRHNGYDRFYVRFTFYGDVFKVWAGMVSEAGVLKQSLDIHFLTKYTINSSSVKFQFHCQLSPPRMRIVSSSMSWLIEAVKFNGIKSRFLGGYALIPLLSIISKSFGIVSRIPFYAVLYWKTSQKNK